jgi:hypothetical protein
MAGERQIQLVDIDRLGPNRYSRSTYQLKDYPTISEGETFNQEEVTFLNKTAKKSFGGEFHMGMFIEDAPRPALLNGLDITEIK